MKKIVIFGTGLFAQVAHFYLARDSLYQVAAFTADEEHIQEKKLLGLPVIPFEKIEKIFPPSKFAMFVAVGYTNRNKVRASKYYAAKNKDYKLISYVNSRATYWDEVDIGDNCFIFENQTIQPFVKIGNDVIIWSGNHIGHHSVIGDHCFISSHVVISGNVKIGPYCFLGVNSTIIDSIILAKETIVGAGALIVKDTKEGGVYRGKASGLSSRRN